MDKTELTVSIETERLEALTYFIQKKGNASLQKELGKVLEKLYEETVPAEVRDYIDAKLRRAQNTRPKPKPAQKTNDKESTTNG